MRFLHAPPSALPPAEAGSQTRSPPAASKPAVPRGLRPLPPVSKERGLNFGEEIDKMDKNNRLLSVVKAFSELDLDPRTIDNVKMGYIFEDLIRKFSENAEAGDHYTGRDIIKLMVNILLAEGCDDIFDDGKVITILDQACGKFQKQYPSESFCQIQSSYLARI